MACGFNEPAIECALIHWAPALKARREPSGQWRADCLHPGCGAERAFQFDVPGRSIRWKSFCGKHDQDAVRPHLIAAVGPCAPGRRSGELITPADLQALALSGLPPVALKVQMLTWSGMSMTAALDKLGVDRTSRYRVRDQVSQFRDKPAGQ